MIKKANNSDLAVGSALIGAGFLTMACSPLLLAWQTFGWLQSAIWPAVSVADVWYRLGGTDPQFTWLGVQSIAQWVLSCSLNGFLLSSGVSLMLLGMLVVVGSER